MLGFDTKSSQELLVLLPVFDAAVVLDVAKLIALVLGVGVRIIIAVAELVVVIRDISVRLCGLRGGRKLLLIVERQLAPSLIQSTVIDLGS